MSRKAAQTGRKHASSVEHAHGRDRGGEGIGRRGEGGRRGRGVDGRKQPRGSCRGQGRTGGAVSSAYEGWSRRERSELYLAANCRFGLLASPAREAFASASSHVGRNFSLGFEWDEDVVFLEMDVAVSANEAGRVGAGDPHDERLRCPISLDTLELPVVTPCGHVFSLASIATDMALREALSGPCPICNLEVAAKELKPLNVRVVEAVEMNGVGRWRLVVRRGEEVMVAGDADGVEGIVGEERQASFSYPLAIDGEARFQKSVIVENLADLYRFMVCRLAARSEEVAAEGGLESEYRYLGYVTAIDVVVDIAKQMVPAETNIDVVLRKDVEGVIAASKRAMASWRRQEKLDEEFPSLVAGGDASSLKGDVVDLKRLKVRCRLTGSVLSCGGDDAANMTDCFYQSADGQRVYLNSLNTDMLRRAGLPSLISARVLDVEVFEQTDAARKAPARKAFRHVPLSSAIGVCEVDLSNVVPEGVSEEFKELIDSNRMERENKALRAFLDNQRRQKAALAARQAEVDAVSAMMRSMPRLGSYGDEEDDVEQTSPCYDTGDSAGLSPSWAVLAKDGFAATGPSLGQSPLDGASPLSSSRETSVPVWGASMATGSSWAPDIMALSTASAHSKTPKAGGKGRKVTLFSSSSNRQYRDA